MAVDPPTKPPLRVLHFGDLHLWRIGWDYDPFPKRALGLTNLWLRRGRAFPRLVAEAIVDQLIHEPADFLLFSGDLATTALRAEFEAGKKLFAPLVERFGARFLAVPGNHDRYTPRATRLRMFESLFLAAPRDYPYATDLNEHWTLVGFDCCVPRFFSSRGGIAREQLARVAELIEQARANGRQVLAMGHYPLAYPASRPPTWEHVLPARHELLTLLERHGAAVYLHGHKHYRWRLQHHGLNHLNCGSAGMAGRAPERRPGFLSIELEPQGLGAVEAVWFDQPLLGQQIRWQRRPLEAQPVGA